MKRVVKDLAIDILGRPWVARLVAAASGPSCVVIMMHRFRSANAGYWGHDPQQLRAVLSALRHAGIALVDLDVAISAFRNGAAPEETLGARLSVAFTVDDGYADSYDVAAPIFAEFDCPVTGFVVPQTVDGALWFWWDRVDHILRNAQRQRFSLPLGSDLLDLRWTDEHGRRVVHAALCERLKSQPTLSVDEFISLLARDAEVDVPVRAPSQYRVMTWNEMRRAESAGWRFGAHSMSHPVLSRCDDDRAMYEVKASVETVLRELQNPSKVFCYPVGRAQDFGMREKQLVKDAGLDMAITAVPGVMRVGMAQRLGDDWSLVVPRFSYDARVGGIPRMFLG